MEEFTEHSLPPIRSLMPWPERRPASFATFENDDNRHLPDLPLHVPRLDSLRDYHRSPLPYSQARQQYQPDVGIPVANHQVSLCSLGRPECCDPPPPYSHIEELDRSCLVRSITRSDPSGLVFGGINPLKREDDETKCSPILPSQVRDDLPIEMSLSDINELVNITKKIRKPYKYDLRPRIPDPEPASSTTKYISPSTSPSPSDSGIALTVSDGSKASQVKHKLAEQNRRNNLDKWIRKMDHMLPDRALDSIGFSLDGKKAVSKEQVLEATVWLLEQLVEAVRRSTSKKGRGDICACQKMKDEYGVSWLEIEGMAAYCLEERRTKEGSPSHPSHDLNHHRGQSAQSLPLLTPSTITNLPAVTYGAVLPPPAATSTALMYRRATGLQKRLRTPEQESGRMTPEKRLRPDGTGYY